MLSTSAGRKGKITFGSGTHSSIPWESSSKQPSIASCFSKTASNTGNGGFESVNRSSARAPISGRTGRLLLNLLLVRLGYPPVIIFKRQRDAYLAALQRAGNEPPFVQSRHEEMSAFMAVGHAKFSGEPGVCMATSGPGAVHLLNGLYDAKLDHVPVVAIVGQTNTTALGGSSRSAPGWWPATSPSSQMVKR